MALNHGAFLNSPAVYNSGLAGNTRYDTTTSFGGIIVDRITIGGVDLATSIDAINKRLSILIPDPKKLEKFEALRQAYSQYQVLEALLLSEDNDA